MRSPLPAIASLALLAATALPAQQPRTWRVEYYHTGGQGSEIFALDRIVVEPLPWPGRPAGNLDPTGGGAYRFEVRDSAGTVLFSRGFSPVFGEWRTTAEASEAHRTFHESLRFPAPAAPVEVVVLERQPGGGLQEVWRVPVDPADQTIDRSTHARYEVIALERHGDPRDKVDFLLMGDGYTAAQCARKFAADAQRMLAALFAQEPFKSRRDEFNVWGICPPARESGISRPSTGVHIDSPLGATYDVFGSERYVLTFDDRAMREVAASAPNEFITILVNGATYGGGGMYGGFTVQK